MLVNKEKAFIDSIINDIDFEELLYQELKESLNSSAKKQDQYQKIRDKKKQKPKQIVTVEKASLSNSFKRKIKKRLFNKKPSSVKPQNEPAAFAVTGISVIIPTYAENDYLYQAVESILNQHVDCKIEIIIGVNGSNIDWYNTIKDHYSDNDLVKVAYTENKGASAGRNVAYCEASFSHVFFLDDDDYLTEGYLQELLGYTGRNIDFVLGYYATHNEDSADDYINNAILKMAQKELKKKSPDNVAIFSTITGKLFSRKFLDKCMPFDESVHYSEDVIFWADNYDKITGTIQYPESNNGNCYVRRITEDSVSRPNASQDKFFLDRINAISCLENKMFSLDYSNKCKSLILRLIKSQNRMMEHFFDECTGSKEAMVAAVNSYEGLYINKGIYSDTIGIAFCHNFPPTIDASAMVSVKRLKQIEQKEGKAINWTVISKNMADVQDVDFFYNSYFAKFIYTDRVDIGGKTAINPVAQVRFAKSAYARSKGIDAEYIYSRVQFPGSHIAAFLYKQEHPDAVWYAEFSDPVMMDATGEKREADRNYEGQEAYLNDFYEMVEYLAYKYADHVIFTNEVQKDYMLSYNPNPELNTAIENKAIVAHHPKMERKFTKLHKSNYQVDKNKINIAYFGRFYKTRGYEDLVFLSKREDVVIHLFVMNSSKYKDVEKENIKLSDQKSYFDFLNIASQMDYLFLNDMTSEFGVIPWLPSKYSDYMSTGRKIIAKYIDGSPISLIDNDQLIKVKSVDDEFLYSLSKQL